MIYDCFTFFNELDLLEIRLNTLDGVVDRFVIAEATRTHRGQPKELLFEKNRDRFAAFANKIDYVVVDDLLPEEEVAKDLLNLPWTNENRQRNAIARGFAGAKDDDVVLVSDLDEIPRPEKVAEAARLAREGEVVRLVLDVFVYYANFRNYNAPRWDIGTVALSAKSFREGEAVMRVPCGRFTVASECAGRCINRVRFVEPTRRLAHGGWHMTYLGGADAIRRKLLSFSHAEAAPLAGRVEERLARGENVLDGMRDSFGVPLDASFPPYLVANRERFAHLVFPVTDDYLRQTRYSRRLATLRGVLYRAAVACVPKCLVGVVAPLCRRIMFRG